jgi:hypothetical protein
MGPCGPWLNGFLPQNGRYAHISDTSDAWDGPRQK